MFFSSRVVPHTPPFVGEVELHGSRRDDRRRQLGSEQRPCAGAQERRAVARPAPRQTPNPCRGTPASRSDTPASERRSPPCAAARARCPARRVSGSSRVGNVQAPRADPSPTFASTASTHCVVVAFVNSACQRAGEPEIQHIGNHREAMRRQRSPPACCLTRRIELIQRVEPQELNTRRGVDALA